MKALKFSKILIILALIFSSCSEDVLDKEPLGVFLNENYLKTEDDVKLSVWAIYDYLQVGYNNYDDWSSIYFAKALPGDDLNTGGGSSGDQPKLQQLNNFTFDYDNPAIRSVWKSFYRIINSSNVLINKITSDINNADHYIAEVKFFRAYAYFELVTMWGSVPYYLENEKSLTVNNPREEVSVIYSQIEKDLKEAILDLPLKDDLSEGMKFRVSKGAAQALLGKVYLYQEKYPLAHAEFQNVIDDNYKVVEDYSKLWLREERAGSESIFEVLYTSENGHDWGGPWDGTAESNFVIQLCGPRGDKSFNNLESIGYVNGWGFAVPTKKIGDLLYSKGGMERQSASVISEADFIAAGGEVNNPAGNNNWDAYEGYIRLKFSTTPSETSSSGVKEVNWNTPFKLIRLADVLLMAAEAYNRDNKDPLAIPLIKEVRRRAGLTDYSVFENLTGDDLFEFIKEERAVELAFEGHRFWDLVRWGDALKELGDRGFQANKNEVFPIPKSEIDLNKGISLDDQNPGYN